MFYCARHKILGARLFLAVLIFLLLRIAPVLAQTEGQVALNTLVALYQNYPNPFGEVTQVDYQLDRPGQITLTVLNSMGKPVKTLVTGQQAAGYYQVTWHGTNEAGKKVASGLYFYHLVTGSTRLTRRMILLH